MSWIPGDAGASRADATKRRRAIRRLGGCNRKPGVTAAYPDGQSDGSTIRAELRRQRQPRAAPPEIPHDLAALRAEFADASSERLTRTRLSRRIRLLTLRRLAVPCRNTARQSLPAARLPKAPAAGSALSRYGPNWCRDHRPKHASESFQIAVSRPAIALGDAMGSIEGPVYQVKAMIRTSKVKSSAASAADALRMLREMQGRDGVTSCLVLQKGVLVSASDLERAARREKGF